MRWVSAAAAVGAGCRGCWRMQFPNLVFCVQHVGVRRIQFPNLVICIQVGLSVTVSKIRRAIFFRLTKTTDMDSSRTILVGGGRLGGEGAPEVPVSTEACPCSQKKGAIDPSVQLDGVVSTSIKRNTPRSVAPTSSTTDMPQRSGISNIGEGTVLAPVARPCFSWRLHWASTKTGGGGNYWRVHNM